MSECQDKISTWPGAWPIPDSPQAVAIFIDRKPENQPGRMVTDQEQLSLGAHLNST